jgi:hypothetical protein
LRIGHVQVQLRTSRIESILGFGAVLDAPRRAD